MVAVGINDFSCLRIGFLSGMAAVTTVARTGIRLGVGCAVVGDGELSGDLVKL